MTRTKRRERRPDGGLLAGPMQRLGGSFARQFALAEGAAHRYRESRQSAGKILLIPGERLRKS